MERFVTLGFSFKLKKTFTFHAGGYRPCFTGKLCGK